MARMLCALNLGVAALCSTRLPCMLKPTTAALHLDFKRSGLVTCPWKCQGCRQDALRADAELAWSLSLFGVHVCEYIHEELNDNNHGLCMTASL